MAVASADPLLATLVGDRDSLGKQRQQARDQGCPLAGSSTLNRLELSTTEKALSGNRNKKIPVDPDALDALQTDLFVESHAKAIKEIWLDLDATDDPLH